MKIKKKGRDQTVLQSNPTSHIQSQNGKKHKNTQSHTDKRSGHTVNKFVDFMVKYLASGCQFVLLPLFLRAFTCETFLEIEIW